MCLRVFENERERVREKESVCAKLRERKGECE
jgi:hypothetical protein